jgi:hypothetical protein
MLGQFGRIPAMMDKVERLVKHMVNQERFGARILRPDPNKLMVFDVFTWGDTQAEMLKTHFPTCSVSCVANLNSASGFIVVVEEKWKGQLAVWFTVYFSVLVLLAACVHQLSLNMHGR